MTVLVIAQRHTHVMDNARALALKEATVSLNKDRVFRNWVSSHDGIYVPVTEKTRPNPYLAQVPERDLTATNGKRLTLLNPAHSLSQVMNDYLQPQGIVVKVTSLNPLNPANMADAWERDMLHRAVSVGKQYSEIVADSGDDYLRVLQPLMTEQGCLKCHRQGYRLGSLRGAVSMKVPLLEYYRDSEANFVRALPLFGFMWLMGLAIIWWAYRNIARFVHDKISDYEQHIFSLVDMIENRDQYTAGHTKRVADYSEKIARELNVNEKDIDLLHRAAMVHDVGKVSTPDSILLKPGQLNDLERKIIQQHVITSYELLRKVKSFEDIAEVVRYHHEQFDGGGYPQGLSGDDIPFLAQIMSVADAFDAMTTNRVYKPKKSPRQALWEMEELAGQQFNPIIVDAAVKVLQDIPVPRTNQQPVNELEKERFAFFYRDQLTGVFNRDYLSYILLTNEMGELDHVCLNMIYLVGFTAINEKHGWARGNEVLCEVSAMLEQEFTEGLVFRVYGDDFVALFESHVEIDTRLGGVLAYLESLGLGVTHRHVRLTRNNMSSVEELDQLLTETVYLS